MTQTKAKGKGPSGDVGEGLPPEEEASTPRGPRGKKGSMGKVAGRRTPPRSQSFSQVAGGGVPVRATSRTAWLQGTGESLLQQIIQASSMEATQCGAKKEQSA